MSRLGFQSQRAAREKSKIHGRHSEIPKTTCNRAFFVETIPPFLLDQKIRIYVHRTDDGTSRGWSPLWPPNQAVEPKDEAVYF
jgi:hypothetical protein